MAVITIVNVDNSGAGSLREAIAAAQDGDTIKFASSLANKTITLDSQIKILSSVTIDGLDADNLTILSKFPLAIAAQTLQRQQPTSMI